MRFTSRLMIAAVALATPVFVAAQAPPAPGPGGQGPGMGMQQRMGPGMGQQMGPRMGMQQRMGQRMRQRFVRRHPGLVMHRMMQDPAMRERLKITPDQVAKFQAHQSTMAKSGIRSRADIQVKRMELAELIRAEKPDRVLIDKKLREVQDATFVQEKARIDSQLTVRDMFTAEQRQEMEKLREEFRGPMMQRGPGGPGQEGMMGPRGQRPMGPPKAPPAQNPPPADNSR